MRWLLHQLVYCIGCSGALSLSVYLGQTYSDLGQTYPYLEQTYPDLGQTYPDLGKTYPECDG